MTSLPEADEEVADFRQWVHGLSHQDLLRAMEFDIVEEEYQLLKDMIALQAPPPTPIHPGIIGYRPATQLGATNGRNDEERIYKARLRNPRLFQLMQTNETPINRMATTSRKTRSARRRKVMLAVKRFDVIARKFVTPWGQVLSVGCTREQRDMDETILQGTRIHHSVEKGRDHCIFCSSSDVLRVLHVASRGKFLTSRPQRSSSSPLSLGAFCAPWLNADLEWFSLPMYLASRFEVALWTSFRGKGQQSSVTSAPWSNPIHGTIAELETCELQSALLHAIVKALTEDILRKDGTLSLIRDGVVWNLLDSSCPTDGNRSTIDVLTSVSSVPLVHLGSSRHKFHKALWNQLQEAIATENEKQILRTLDNEAEASTAATATPRRNKKAKAKKKRKKMESACLKSESRPVTHNASVASLGRKGTAVKVRMPLTDPKAIADAKEQTRKMIIAGLIVEDVLDNVFSQLGLNELPSDEEMHSATSNGAVIDVKKPNRLPPVLNDNAMPQSAKPIRELKETFREDKHKKEESFTTQIHIEDNEAFPKLPVASDALDDDTERAPFDEDPLPTVQPSHSNKEDFHLESEFFNVPWIFNDTVDHWDKLKRYPNREKSLLADLFLSQKRDVDNDAHVASSTAASIASSSDKGGESEEDDPAEVDQKGGIDVRAQGASSPLIAPVLEEAVLEAVAASINDAAANNAPLETLTVSEKSQGEFTQTQKNEGHVVDQSIVEGSHDKKVKDIIDDCRSPSPDAPQTPPPQLSPILVSLADLQTIRARAATESVESPKALSFSAISAGSLPSSPMPASGALTQSWSREDLRIHSFADDQRLPNRNKGFPLKKRTSAPLSYRAAAAKTLPKARVSSGVDGRSSFIEVATRDLRSNVTSAMSIPDLRPSISSKNESDTCAQSETAIELHSYDVPLNDAPRTGPRYNTEVSISTKDDGLAGSPSRENASSEEIAVLRDERNAFCDMCLTLGAEVSKLKNLLAAHQNGASSYARPEVASKSSYDSELYQPYYFHGMPKATTTVGAMSDAGTHRGDHDSAFSEDGTDGFGHENTGRPLSVHVRPMSSNATIAGSDLSVEQNVGQAILGAKSFRSLSRDVIGSISGQNGMQSRLTTDIMNFLRAKSSALRIQDSKKTAAIERLTRLVTAIWPRAQVKIYGSHVTGLCLPSSDLDFVVCLPAVHKNAPAVAPGALEGRNAINESSQKTLARMLKGESRIDPRSIKIIERTVVPVIKVSTKDTRARMIQLDISFDGPEHHGLAANQMIADTLQELPMIQPLVLILKQFLKDRGLLTAYTGGLSSYGLFLMVTRYLQEHSSSWDDCGSLLMGFLDFYGNSFDPRVTGIGRRQYFARLNYAHPQQMWDVSFPQHLGSKTTSSVGGRPDLIKRRNSFNENATMDGLRVSVSPAVSVATTPHVPRPPRFQHAHHRFPNQQYQIPAEQSAQTAYDQSSRPYTFDPLFIEDPLSQGNNVGRNAFRVFQVQRAFSDAHRALVASLEWDIHSSHDLHDGEYPLLNCLLQSEDVFYELDE